MKGAGLYQDRGAMGKLPVHRKMGDMFPHSAPTQESDWLRYRGVFDHYKDGEMSGAGVMQTPVAPEHTVTEKQKETEKSSTGWSSLGKFKHPKGGTVEGFKHTSGATQYTINKGGYFTNVKQSDFDEAQKSSKYETYKAEAAAAKKKKSEKKT